MSEGRAYLQLDELHEGRELRVCGSDAREDASCGGSGSGDVEAHCQRLTANVLR